MDTPDHQTLSVSPQGPYFADAGQAVTAARYANDHYAGLVRDHPTRFSAFAALPLPHPAARHRLPLPERTPAAPGRRVPGGGPPAGAGRGRPDGGHPADPGRREA
ncbi:hypothetical protein RB199_08115 [Streptomyces libani]